MATVRRVALAMVRRAKLSRSLITGGNCEFRRWYILPSQLPATAAEYLANTGISLAAEWAHPAIYPVPEAEINVHAVRSAKFAIRSQNESSHSEANLQFMRVLRASCRHFASGDCHKYYVTFEALRGKADMDVYYAEVVHRKVSDLTTRLELIKWHLVDDSFSYPRYGSSDCDSAKPPHEPQRIVQEMLDSGISLPKKLKMNSQPANVIFDINNFEIVCEYALFAVTTHNENEDDKVHLKNLLWACKSKVHDNWIYRLVLEATNREHELEAYYAIVKFANNDKSLELMEWYSIPRAFLESNGKKVSKRNRDNAKQNANRKGKMAE